MTKHLEQNVTQLAALASLAAAFFMPASTNAAQSNSVQVEGAEIRLVVSPPEEDGRIPAILAIRLAPGWKTYWVDPGASGLPPELVITDPGLHFEGLRFPAPRAFVEGTARSFGYDTDVALPLRLSASAGAAVPRVTAQVMLGVCKEICIPVQATLQADLTSAAAASPLDRARISLAEDKLPARPRDGFRMERAQETKEGLTLMLQVPEGPAPQLFLSSSVGVTFGPIRIVPLGAGHYRADVALRLPKGMAQARQAGIDAVLVSGGEAVEAPLVFD
ncbi:protein-disulfide reductase DsbD domain-containing protein [Xaviernesmea oryzae]|uniref:protein-disulfide reductase DsbD domain-containing protein n=1 Tax=Xaviernesmea oryzae TaxID=464029 RepID=UPI00094F8131|nr:protein-disulfide reductase DsbD domain-containing protein [Xaviernesmea oryzae]